MAGMFPRGLGGLGRAEGMGSPAAGGKVGPGLFRQRAPTIPKAPMVGGMGLGPKHGAVATNAGMHVVEPHITNRGG